MNELEFNDSLDALYECIEEAVDDLDLDTDCEIAGSVLSVHCPDGSSLIFSRQPSTQQLWLAARSGAFHFHQPDGQWLCTRSGRSFDEIFAEVCLDQLGQVCKLD